MYLYLIRNAVNGKGYVGITTNAMSVRWLQHLQAAGSRQKQTLLARAIRKYGADVFTMTLLGQAENWTLLQAMERAAIQEYGTFRPHGYNMTLGGDGAFGLIQTPAHRRKIGDAQLGEKNHRYGTHVTEEHKEALRRAHRGNTYSLGKMASAETRTKLSAAGLGRHHTPEAKEAIGAAKRGKPRSPEVRATLAEKTRTYLALHGNPMQGRTHSAETRAKIAAKAQGRPGHAPSAENTEKLRAASTGGNNHMARVLAINGTVYPSMMDAVRALGSTLAKVKRMLKDGQAVYCDSKVHIPWNRGVKATPEHRAKLSASRTGGKNWHASAISLDGVEYPSIMDAVRATGLSRMQVSY